MNLDVKEDFQICISVPLKEFQLKCEVCDLAFRFRLKCISSLFK